MGILDRFSIIVKSNINALLDKAEDPGKMIDQYLLEMTESLAEVKKETAGVMAEESRTKAKVDANQAEIDKYTALAKKALQAGNEEDGVRGRPGQRPEDAPDARQAGGGHRGAEAPP